MKWCIRGYTFHENVFMVDAHVTYISELVLLMSRSYKTFLRVNFLLAMGMYEYIPEAEIKTEVIKRLSSSDVDITHALAQRTKWCLCIQSMSCCLLIMMHCQLRYKMFNLH